MKLTLEITKDLIKTFKYIFSEIQKVRKYIREKEE